MVRKLLTTVPSQGSTRATLDLLPPRGNGSLPPAELVESVVKHNGVDWLLWQRLWGPEALGRIGFSLIAPSAIHWLLVTFSVAKDPDERHSRCCRDGSVVAAPPKVVADRRGRVWVRSVDDPSVPATPGRHRTSGRALAGSGSDGPPERAVGVESGPSPTGRAVPRRRPVHVGLHEHLEECRAASPRYRRRVHGVAHAPSSSGAAARTRADRHGRAGPAAARPSEDVKPSS